jgi:hypothetical protein
MPLASATSEITPGPSLPLPHNNTRSELQPTTQLQSSRYSRVHFSFSSRVLAKEGFLQR